jgi:hypothetical protein
MLFSSFAMKRILFHGWWAPFAVGAKTKVLGKAKAHTRDSRDIHKIDKTFV